ncbi:MAG: phosphoribosylformylglycinamidine synthase subunit PurS [Alphaproteobacteria bacterium]|nr:phosphoribosylformylglycinamidine synthase subunit PurS [Alphaproteobacteria bacterium]
MTEYRIAVQVSLRPDILDPAGRAAEKSLQSMGFAARDARIGKTITLTLDAADAAEAEAKAEQMADQLLANPVMENCSITVTPRM